MRYHLGIFKCGVSREGLFKSDISLKDCKECLEPKVQDSELEPVDPTFRLMRFPLDGELDFYFI